MVRKVESTGVPPEGEPESAKKKDLSLEDEKTSRIGRKKAKEAEDIYNNPATPSLKRRSFESGDSPGLAKDAIEQRQGALWECIDRMPAPYGGYVYIFVSRYDNERKQHEVLAKISPAVEPLTKDLMEQLSPNRAAKGYQGVQKWLFKLGYKYEYKPFTKEGKTEWKEYLYIPDKEALESGWKKLQEELPKLPNLAICSSEGIASDIEFVEAYLTHDAVLSSDKEFVHDSMLHVVPALASLIHSAIPESKASGGPFVSERENIREKVRYKYQRIMLVKREMQKNPKRFESGKFKRLKEYFAQIEYHLSAVVDFISAGRLSGAAEGTKAQKDLKALIEVTFAHYTYNNALENRYWAARIEEAFGSEASSVDWIKELHELCDDVIWEIEKRA